MGNRRPRTCPGCAIEHTGHVAHCQRCRRALRTQRDTKREPRRTGFTIQEMLTPKGTQP